MLWLVFVVLNTVFQGAVLDLAEGAEPQAPAEVRATGRKGGKVETNYAVRVKFEGGVLQYVLELSNLNLFFCKSETVEF